MINWLEKLNKPKNYLLLANILLVFFLIVLGNVGVIPLKMGDFVFFTILALAFALWRPSWAFLFFCGVIPLENVNLAPLSLGIAVRPYQFIGGLLILALIIRKLGGRLNFKLVKFNVADWAVVMLVAAGFLSAVVGAGETRLIASLHLTIIFATFAALYFLTRNYIQDMADLKKTVPFFLSSAVVVALFGIWQNVMFLHGGNSFEVMAGRPNGTFSEADWLGGYLVLFIILIYSLLYYRHSERSEAKSKNLLYGTTSDNNEQILRPAGRRPQDDETLAVAVLRMTGWGLYFLLTLLYITLILTVSRSAWLAALAVYVIFVSIFFTDLRFRNWRWKETSLLKLKIVSSLVVAVLIVFVFHLTNFQLGNRVQSTGTGKQKITVVCMGEDAMNRVSTDTTIYNTPELEKIGCRQINLEDIESEKEAGNFVTEVYRDDPNVSVRAEIYQKSWNEIRNHWALGIGWGSIGPLLGQDGRGTALNSSDIFLETWLGAGAVGILGLLGILGWILFNAIKNFFYAENHLQKAFYLFIITGWFGLIIFNLFNAGIFLGFLWVWLAVVQIKNL